MRLQKRVIYSLVFALAIFFISMFAKFIPCQTAPVIPNPEYKWTVCNLNPDTPTLGITRLYFGYTPNLTESYFLALLLSFLIAMIVLHFLRDKKF